MKHIHLTDRNIHIELLSNDHGIPFDLLELADPSMARIKEYLKTGKCFVAKAGNAVVGVMVLEMDVSEDTEILNIAVSPPEQGKGIGKLLLRYAEHYAKGQARTKLIIGTGNSSIGQLALYQKEGFEIIRIERDFFTKYYDTPIVENGIVCKHRIILEKTLN